MSWRAFPGFHSRCGPARRTSTRDFGDARDVLESVEGDKKATSSCLMAQAVFEAGLGHFEEARKLITQARELLEDIALTVWLSGPLAQFAGWVELLADDALAAERELRWGFDKLTRDRRAGVAVDGGLHPRRGSVCSGALRRGGAAHDGHRGVGRCRRRVLAGAVAERAREDADSARRTEACGTACPRVHRVGRHHRLPPSSLACARERAVRCSPGQAISEMRGWC